MNIKRVTILAIIILLVGISVIFYIFRYTYKVSIDTVAVNDIAQSLAEQWGNLDKSNLPCPQYGLDYVVIDNSGSLVGATKSGLNEDINAAISNRDTIVDIKLNDKVTGKLIIYNNTNELWEKYKNNLLVFSAATTIFIILFCVVYAAYLDKLIFRPFRKLRAFARHVAEGNLDVPLQMDRGNMFGAFTESFDLMREELSKAREGERIANQSKKELVASLSHDIKTPVASIKAVSEVMILKSDNEESKRQLEVINSKADQINTLITNMFNATLEELQELNVTVTEQPSGILYDLIRNADYDNRAAISHIPECIVLTDKLRLLQVVDNIISNSYKYADTPIGVMADIKGQYLQIEFKDYGSGVSSDEVALLFNKFYRAKNSAGKSGTGLGLYISKYLMNKMSGDIECKNVKSGFIVVLKILIA
ncbi:MAG: hypothetical protein K0R90_1163 [Oscillospiraceae bacterium]|jgi:signal transduction histidine kinase|nr:hypothetical protein [Oscillospiraceae bacterium]